MPGHRHDVTIRQSLIGQLYADGVAKAMEGEPGSDLAFLLEITDQAKEHRAESTQAVWAATLAGNDDRAASRRLA
jgi:hypothetical protein